jgi:purine-cytosine permease-like protein
MKKLPYFFAGTGIVIGVALSVRMGALIIAVATALFVAPGFKAMRAIEKVIPITLVVSLITIALALPRR